MNIWRDINGDRIKPEDFIVCVEIEQGSKNKYELDKETGLIILDRVLYTSTHYPMNYGFIPKTYSGDNDPLDVFVLCSQPIEKMSLVRCYPIGVVRMIDREEVDEKLKGIMANIHQQIVDALAACDIKEYNLVQGANLAGFKKVAEAMIAQGIV